MENTFVESDCTITHQGKSFTCGGAWIADCTDGRQRGVVYVKPEKPECGRDRYPFACHGIVTDWHGNKIAAAYFGNIYQGNYCRMRVVTFTHNGRRFSGRYCPDTSQAVRVTSNLVKVSA